MKSNVVELLGLPLPILKLRKLYNFQGYAKKEIHSDQNYFRRVAKSSSIFIN